MLRDGNFRPEELSAIAFGYTKLLEESNEVLTELRNVVNITTLSRPTGAHGRGGTLPLEDEAYRNLVSYYTKQEHLP